MTHTMIIIFLFHFLFTLVRFGIGATFRIGREIQRPCMRYFSCHCCYCPQNLRGLVVSCMQDFFMTIYIYIDIKRLKVKTKEKASTGVRTTLYGYKGVLNLSCLSVETTGD